MIAQSNILAHHSVLHYDGKTEVVISGTIVGGKFAFPHSEYQVDVTDEEGAVERWILRTEDPRDAKRLGFADALKALKYGDELTIVGWPHRFEDKELRGHQLHFPDGRVVFLRLGNYIWPKDIKQIGRYVNRPETLEDKLTAHASAEDPVQQVVEWARENDPVARVAFVIAQDRARLIGIDRGEGAVFAGVEELLQCHSRRTDFISVIDLPSLVREKQEKIVAASAYIAEFNRLLSRWWEQERSTCS